MLTEKQIQEIREYLKQAQNPLFFFDNDIDGLASFLLLRRYIERGKGVAIKSFPDLNVSYARKLYELKPDYVFVLDKPLIAEDFIKEASQLNIPLVWLDHHEVDVNTSGTIYYNPTKNKNKSSEPTSFWAYKITKKKDDLWIAMMGCIADGFLSKFTNEFKEKYPELWKENIKTAFQTLYETEIGRIARILAFALKDRTTNVVKMLKFLVEIKNPQDILEENNKTYTILHRFKQVNEKYKKLIERAKKQVKEKFLYFQYGGELSLSADIANELSYLYPEKIIVVAYIKGIKANISIRGKSNIRKITIKAIEGLEGATGGGHLHATGAQVLVEDLPKFKERFVEMI